MTKIPTPLVEAIQSGRCIAFVGAGFSRPGNILLWSELLRKLTYQHVSVDSDAYKYLVKVLGPQDSSNVLAAHELDLAAQVLEDKVKNFRDILRQEIRNGQLNETMNQRISAMQQIPFRALLTTNYDSFLVGKKGDGANGEATRPTFEEILQGPTRDWFDMLIVHPRPDPRTAQFTPNSSGDRRGLSYADASRAAHSIFQAIGVSASSRFAFARRTASSM